MASETLIPSDINPLAQRSLLCRPNPSSSPAFRQGNGVSKQMRYHQAKSFAHPKTHSKSYASDDSESFEDDEGLSFDGDDENDDDISDLGDQDSSYFHDDSDVEELRGVAPKAIELDSDSEDEDLTEVEDSYDDESVGNTEDDVSVHEMMNPIEYETHALLQAIQSQMQKAQFHKEAVILPSPSAVRSIQTPTAHPIQKANPECLSNMPVRGLPQAQQKVANYAANQPTMVEPKAASDASRKRTRTQDSRENTLPKKHVQEVDPRRVSLVKTILETLPRQKLKGIMDIVMEAGAGEIFEDELIFDVYSMDECVVRKIELFVHEERDTPKDYKVPKSFGKQSPAAAKPTNQRAAQKLEQRPISTIATSQSKPSPVSTSHGCHSPTSSLASVGSSPSSSSSLSSPVAHPKGIPTRSKSMSDAPTPRRSATSVTSYHNVDVSKSKPAARPAKSTPPQPQTKRAVLVASPKVRKETPFFTEHERNAIFSTNEVLVMKKTETESEDEIEVDI